MNGVTRNPKEDSYEINIESRDKIRAHIEDAGDALAVHCALSMCACDAHSNRFEVTTEYIARLSGLSRHATAKILVQLERIGIVKVEPNVINPKHFASTFTLEEVSNVG